MNHDEEQPGLGDDDDGAFWPHDVDVSALHPQATQLMEDLKSSIAHNPYNLETFYTEYELMTHIGHLDELSCQTVLHHLEYYFDMPKDTIRLVIFMMLNDPDNHGYDDDLSDTDTEEEILNDNDIENVSVDSVDSGFREDSEEEDVSDAFTLNSSNWTSDELENDSEESGIDD